MSRSLTIAEVADWLKITRARAYELARTGQLPGAFRIGARQLRVDEDTLQRWRAEGGSLAPSPHDDA